MKTAQRYAFKAMEDPEFAATEARYKFYEIKIAYRNHLADNGEYGARNVSMYQA